MKKSTIKKTLFSLGTSAIAVVPIATVASCSCSTSDSWQPVYDFNTKIVNCYDQNETDFNSLNDVKESARFRTNQSDLRQIQSINIDDIMDSPSSFINEIIASFTTLNNLPIYMTWDTTGKISNLNFSFETSDWFLTNITYGDVIYSFDTNLDPITNKTIGWVITLPGGFQIKSYTFALCGEISI